MNAPGADALPATREVFQHDRIPRVLHASVGQAGVDPRTLMALDMATADEVVAAARQAVK
jgi:hypothetical protein